MAAAAAAAVASFVSQQQQQMHGGASLLLLTHAAAAAAAGNCGVHTPQVAGRDKSIEGRRDPQAAAREPSDPCTRSKQQQQ